MMMESRRSETAADLKNASQHVPIVLVQTGTNVPEHLEEQVDVVIDESTFSTVGPWLIEELREVRFPMFVEWFEAWEEPTADKGRGMGHIY